MRRVVMVGSWPCGVGGEEQDGLGQASARDQEGVELAVSAGVDRVGPRVATTRCRGRPSSQRFSTTWR